MNILGIGAHFDDLELGCGGSLIRHAMAGDKVTMLVITHSGYVNPNGESVRKKETALKEGKAAAEIIGGDLVCLDFPTLEFDYNEALTRKLQKIIDDRQIDTIYNHWDSDLHRDHRFAALSGLMAGRHVPRFLMYRSNYYVTGQSFDGNFYTDISPLMAKKEAALLAHASELKRVKNNWVEFMKRQDANHGLIIGVDFAECFKVVRYLV